MLFLLSLWSWDDDDDETLSWWAVKEAKWDNGEHRLLGQNDWGLQICCFCFISSSSFCCSSSGRVSCSLVSTQGNKEWPEFWPSHPGLCSLCAFKCALCTLGEHSDSGTSFPGLDSNLESSAIKWYEVKICLSLYLCIRKYHKMVSKYLLNRWIIRLESLAVAKHGRTQL